MEAVISKKGGWQITRLPSLDHVYVPYHIKLPLGSYATRHTSTYR
jgi:hypothetical protein